MTGEVAVEIAVVALCLFAGGILKGATGAGAPVLAVPAIAAFFDVRFAVVVMLVSNFSTNLWQGIRFRDHLPGWRLILPLVAGGMIGVTAGTLALRTLPADLLSIVVALAVLGYVGLRLARPHWRLDMRLGEKLALPAGFAAGLLQGAAGLSAPISITFLNALRMGREPFIAAISALFVSFTSVQAIALIASGLVAPGELVYSALALAPVSLGMPAGAALARRISLAALDRVILALLSVIALKLLLEALF